MKEINFRILFFICLSVWLGTCDCFAKYGGGSGTAGDPYLIYTPEQMNEIGINHADWDRHFALMADIDLSDYTADEFNLIGSSASDAFSGVFDGRGHIISNFTYESDEFAVGLFRFVVGENAVVKNLIMVNPDVTGLSMAGVIAGSISDGQELVSEDGRIENCRITGGSVYVSFGTGGGAIAGDISGAVVANCCSVDTYIDGFDVVGGLAGYNEGGLMINCLAANPLFSINETVGALVGEGANGYYSGCFYDSSINNSLTGLGDGNDPCGVSGETTAVLQQAATYLDEGWPIITPSGARRENIWRMCTDGVDYPRLWVEFNPADFVCPDGVDIYDLAALAGEWMYELLEAKVDFNEDTVVNFRDWAVLAAAWYSTDQSENYNPLVDIAPAGGDGYIDELDVSIFADYWLRQGLYFLNADIEPYGGDGVVDFADYAAFANQWLASD